MNVSITIHDHPQEADVHAVGEGLGSLGYEVEHMLRGYPMGIEQYTMTRKL